MNRYSSSGYNNRKSPGMASSTISNNEQQQSPENLNEIAQVVVSISETHSELINTLKNEVETLSRFIQRFS
jgi:hypothetical protein